MTNMSAAHSKACCRPKTRTSLDTDALALALKALAHPVRLHLVRFLLRRGECVFGELPEHLGLAPSTVSQHVSVLREAGILCAQPEGRAVCYCVDRARIEEVTQSLLQLSQEHPVR